MGAIAFGIGRDRDSATDQPPDRRLSEMAFRSIAGDAGESRSALMFLDEGYGIRDGADVLGLVVFDFAVEFLLPRHDDLEEVERVGVKIADE
ncbi:MAG: hypothetical protein ACR2OO_17915, partial [Thermomicrobiales bacterium]